MRDAENDDRHGDENEIIEHADGDVRQLLAEQIFQAPGGRDIEVDDGAELLLAHHADRHQNGRDQNEQDRRDARDDRIDALERRIIHVAVLKGRRIFPRTFGQLARRVSQRIVLDALDILRNGLAAKGVGAIDLGQNLRPQPFAQIAPEARRDLDDERNIIRLQTPERVLGRTDGTGFEEVAGRSANTAPDRRGSPLIDPYRRSRSAHVQRLW